MFKKINLFCIELEITPYKIDMWNKLISSNKFNIDVFFTEEKILKLITFMILKKFPKIFF